MCICSIWSTKSKRRTSAHSFEPVKIAKKKNRLRKPHNDSFTSVGDVGSFSVFEKEPSRGIPILVFIFYYNGWYGSFKLYFATPLLYFFEWFSNIMQETNFVLAWFLNRFMKTFSSFFLMCFRKITASIPRQIRNGNKWRNEVIQRPSHNDAVIDVVVSDHDHCSNADAWKKKATSMIYISRFLGSKSSKFQCSSSWLLLKVFRLKKNLASLHSLTELMRSCHLILVTLIPTSQ